MWRESVYSGTLRPQQDLSKQITGTHLDRLLDELVYSRSSNSSLSSKHSINQIEVAIYLGDRYAAKDKKFLLANGITHVLNAAEGYDEYQVNTSADYYRDAGIKYLGIPGHDRPSWNISAYFNIAAQFIASALKQGGSVFVHCVVGVSRSATLLIAYLMIERGMSAAAALRYVHRRRRINPNPGFLHQLAELDNTLTKRRTFYPSTTTRARLLTLY